MNKEIRQSSSLRKKHVVVNDRMQKGYRYQLSAPTGRNFASDFKPELTPRQLLKANLDSCSVFTVHACLFCASNNNNSSTACLHLHKIIGTTLPGCEAVIFAPTLDQFNFTEAIVLKDNASTAATHQVILISGRWIDVIILIPIVVIEIWIIMEMPMTMLRWRLVSAALFDGRRTWLVRPLF